MNDKSTMLPCPFCEGNAVECWSKTKTEPVGQSWIGGCATAYIACGKCMARGRKVVIECGPRDATDKDVDEALMHARIFWGARPTNGIVEHIRNVIGKHFRKQDNEDRSLDWNLGFNDCCQWLLQEILIAEGGAEVSDIKSETLLPCPFCGAAAVLARRLCGSYDVICETAGCIMEYGADWFVGKEEAIAAWNKRAEFPKTEEPK